MIITTVVFFLLVLENTQINTKKYIIHYLVFTKAERAGYLRICSVILFNRHSHSLYPPPPLHLEHLCNQSNDMFTYLVYYTGTSYL